MNTQILYDLARIYELMGLSHESAFECAFNEYKAIIDIARRLANRIACRSEDEIERLRRLV